MELYKEILTELLKKEEINIVFQNFTTSVTEIIENECYKTLQEIKAIIEDNSLNDFECVEKIVCVFESIGSDGGNRHDFG